jgi:dTDP-4-dehydrorhamnose 3,5-epimerase
MIFTATALPGVVIVDPEPVRDERGAFARTYCRDEFARAGIAFTTIQCNTSFNAKRGTLRGLHYQAAPAGEPKLVRCTRGVVFDVAVDLRKDSPGYCRWIGAELSAENGRALFIPEGCAHGFVTLVDASEVFYQMGAAYAPELARGVRWNDPAFAIAWPIQPSTMAPRDAAYADFVP